MTQMTYREKGTSLSKNGSCLFSQTSKLRFNWRKKFLRAKVIEFLMETLQYTVGNIHGHTKNWAQKRDERLWSSLEIWIWSFMCSLQNRSETCIPAHRWQYYPASVSKLDALTYNFVQNPTNIYNMDESGVKT